jgi:hypothetical protein
MKINILISVYHTEKKKGDNYNHIVLDGLSQLGLFEIVESDYLPSINDEDTENILSFAKEKGFIPDENNFHFTNCIQRNLPDSLKSEFITFSFPAKKA